MNLKTFAAVCVSALSTLPGLAAASPVFVETFNSYSGWANAREIGTGLSLSAFGTVSGWTAGGVNAVHAVDFGGGDYAPMFFMNNTLTQNTGFAGNVIGNLYTVSLGAAPTLYSGLAEATTASDGLVISLLRADASVLMQQVIRPGAWTGGANGQALHDYAFNYLGDGSSNLHFRIASLNDTAYRFGGVVDNLRVSDVPEPASLALVLLALGTALAAGRRRRNSSNSSNNDWQPR